jgi:plastocyanin
MRRLMVLVGVVAVLGLASCSGDTTTTPTDGETSSSTGGGAGTLTIADIAFSPSSVTAGDGGTLTITNEDSVTHTFTMDDGSVDEEVPGGGSIEVTITAAGPFHCNIHPSMTGTVSLG